MPGTVIREHVVQEMNGGSNGFRKQADRGQLWMLESAVQEFQKRYQLPGIFRVIDSIVACESFSGQPALGTNFVHADECETSLSGPTRDGRYGLCSRHRRENYLQDMINRWIHLGV